MRVIVLLAFRGANLTGSDAGLDLRAEHVDVLSAAPNGQPRGRSAHVRAIEAGADAFPHIHLLGHAGVGA